MSYDPWLDPPRSGCGRSAAVVAGLVVMVAVLAVVAPLWGLSDAVALLCWLGVAGALLAGLRWTWLHADDDDEFAGVEARREVERVLREPGRR